MTTDKTVDAILNELTDRKGFDAWWDEIGAENRDEIQTRLKAIVDQHWTPSEG